MRWGRCSTERLDLNPSPRLGKLDAAKATRPECILAKLCLEQINRTQRYQAPRGSNTAYHSEDNARAHASVSIGHDARSAEQYRVNSRYRSALETGRSQRLRREFSGAGCRHGEKRNSLSRGSLHRLLPIEPHRPLLRTQPSPRCSPNGQNRLKNGSASGSQACRSATLGSAPALAPGVPCFNR